MKKLLLSGDEAVALAARHLGVHLGVGYPGTPSTEILENFSEFGGKAQWSPNEKVALEVAIGVAFAGGRALCTMKHVGVNVAADALFTAAYTGVTGGLVLVSADDPGMASSQNEQDNRNYAKFAGVPVFEPSDSQEAYDFTRQAMHVSERFGTIVILRLTTRICHSNTIVVPGEPETPPDPLFKRDIPARVMVPAYARPAHRRLRQRLQQIAAWNEAEGPRQLVPGTGNTGMITSGITFQHLREAAPEQPILKLGMTYPLPLNAIREFAGTYEKLQIVEEGDDYLLESLLAAGIQAEGKSAEFRFGEMNVDRVRRILAGEPDAPPSKGKGTPPRLCPGCPHRKVFETLRDLGCIVSGDIGCYSLGVLPPYEAIDTIVCMGASIGVGLGMRHALGSEQGKKVVSVIGDSTFMHSGITGIVDMVYNPPPGGHLVLILDNNTTAMTGLQEHPGTGRQLNHDPGPQVVIEDVVRGCGVSDVTVLDPAREADKLATAIREALDSERLSVIITRRECVLSVKKQRAQTGTETPAATGGAA